MARYGTLGDYRFTDTQEAAIDIRGSKVYGRKDQELGKIDDVVFDEATGANRNVTPTTQQQAGAGSGTIPASEADTAEVDTRDEVTPFHTDATMEISAAGPSLRWSTFEDTLRQRREEVLQSSIDRAKMEDEKRVPGGTLSEPERIERRKAS